MCEIQIVEFRVANAKVSCLTLISIRYYCDYCDTFLTHDSPSVRKTHCSGQRHKDAVRNYYQTWLEAQVQKLVDHASEAYKSGKVPTPAYGGPMSVPPMGMPPVGMPRYPPMMGAPTYPHAPPMMPAVRPPPQRWGS